MTKKYIVTKDQVQQDFTVPTSNAPVSVVAVKTELDKKLAIKQTTADAGKVVRVGTDGNLTLLEQTQADWSQATESDVSFIKNKPFKTIGSGLSVSQTGVLTADTQLHFEIVESLPAEGDSQTIYLVPNTGEGQNVYDEYVWVNKGTEEAPEWGYERLGTTDFKLDITQTSTGITINNTPLQSATDSQTGLLTSADHATFVGKQNKLHGTAGSVATYTSTDGTLSEVAIASDLSASDGKLVTNTAVNAGLAKKVDLSDASSPFKIGKDADGYYLED